MPERKPCEPSEERKDSRLPRPHIEQFSSYRTLVEAFYLYKKSKNPRFSHRRLAQMLGAKSPGYLQEMIAGKRSLSDQAADKLCRIFEFSETERSYFMLLVSVENRESAQVSSARTLLPARAKIAVREADTHNRDVFSDWYLPVIHLLSHFPDFEEDPVWISKRLQGRITPEEAALALFKNKRMELLKKHGGPKGKPSGLVLRDPDPHQIHPMHAQLLELWLREIPNRTREECVTIGLNFRIPKAMIPELRKRMQEVAYEFMGMITEPEEVVEPEIVQVGMYMFPLTH